MKASRSLIRDFGEIENLQVSKKAPGDFVSSADKRTEKIIIGELQKAHPNYGIITEESGIINKNNIFWEKQNCNKNKVITIFFILTLPGLRNSSNMQAHRISK